MLYSSCKQLKLHTPPHYIHLTYTWQKTVFWNVSSVFRTDTVFQCLINVFPFMCFSVLDLPLCQDTQDFDDKALHPNPALWSPKTRRLEVSVIPRPRPSPIRPRIDPWSFISAGGGNSGGGRSPHRSESNLLSYQPSPTNPFTNCDPFPSPDCDPFALKADPSSGSDGASPFDPFSAPFPTSRSAPCSANGSPTLPSFRIAPINSADSALIDFGCGACNKPLDGTKERAHPRRILGLKPFKSPTQLKDDRFWIQPCPDKGFILNDRCYEPGFDCRNTVQDRFHYYVLLRNKDSECYKKKTCTLMTQPTKGGFPLWEHQSSQVLFIHQPAALETRKPVKGGTMNCGIAACEPIAGAHFILSLFPSVSLSLWRSRIQITSPIFRYYQTAHINCFHLPLPLKHCDNAEVDKATCTASSASTSLQTERLQDNGKLECLISWSVFNIYLFKALWMVNLVRREDATNLA